MPSTVTMRNIAPTTIPAMAPVERPLLLELETGAAFGVAMTGPRGAVLVVVGPSTPDVDSLVLDAGLRVTNDTSKFVAILPAEVAATEALIGIPPEETAAPKVYWSNTERVSPGSAVQSHSVTSVPPMVE